MSILLDAARFERVGEHYVLYGQGDEELVRLDARLVLKCQRISLDGS